MENDRGKRRDQSLKFLHVIAGAYICDFERR